MKIIIASLPGRSVTPVSVSRHRRFRDGPDIPRWGRRAVAESAHIDNPETLINAVMRGVGTAGDRLISRKSATRTGRPGLYFPVRRTSR